MKRLALLAAPLLVLAACASTPAPKPPTTAELLLGTWTCETKSPDATVTVAPLTYVAGGKSTFHMTVSGNMGAMSFEVVGDGEGMWVLNEADMLEDKVVSVKVTGAKMNGNAFDPNMAQGMIEQQVVNKTSTGKIVVTKTTMTQTTPEGQVTNCSR